MILVVNLHPSGELLRSDNQAVIWREALTTSSRTFTELTIFSELKTSQCNQHNYFQLLLVSPHRDFILFQYISWQLNYFLSFEIYVWNKGQKYLWSQFRIGFRSAIFLLIWQQFVKSISIWIDASEHILKKTHNAVLSEWALLTSRQLDRKFLTFPGQISKLPGTFP